MTRKRIFWLGMHKILVKTELPRIRQLGFEVFNPPYLSDRKDQSACLDWDLNQATTLPKDIFDKLANYNFFYNVITPEMADILNAYFDTVILTIEPLWLIEMLKVFKGKIIYRLYGHTSVLSKVLESHKAMHMITSRDNFWVVPHAIESAMHDDSWFRERESIVPYCLTPDVFEFQDTWRGITHKNAEIALTCPNVTNPYYEKHYHFLQENFYQSHYKYYGVQVSTISKPNLVGTLPRTELISRFQKSSGYLYTYTEPTVCFLPPIEMMIFGGPVLYLAGSLLDKYFKHHSPGRCVNIEEAHYKAGLLLKNDNCFVEEVIASQQEVRDRYHPDKVWPIFDKTFRELLAKENKASNWHIMDERSLAPRIKRIYIFYHYSACDVIFCDGVYSAYEGIARVVRQIVLILAAMPDIEICITAKADQAVSLNGYFRDHPHKDKVRIICINPNELQQPIVTQSVSIDKRKQIVPYIKNIIKLGMKSIFLKKHWEFLKKIVIKMQLYHQDFRDYQRSLNYINENSKSYDWHIDVINQDSHCTSVFIPHYYLFPDALRLKQKSILYLPDYMPHFFHDTKEFKKFEGIHTRVGRLLAQKAHKVFCNSNFTKSYLPHSRLNVSSEKIEVSYLPCLNVVKKEGGAFIDKELLSKPYIFYPTRARPNKNLSLLLSVFEILVNNGHDINLVLTTKIDSDKKALDVFCAMKHQSRVLFFYTVSDEQLAELYRHAAMLCFTSLAEGNFPPQILEALIYQTPVVASRLEFITERIPNDFLDAMILCEANNEQAFVQGCEKLLMDRTSIIKKQNQLYHAMKQEDNDLSFRKNILELFNVK